MNFWKERWEQGQTGWHNDTVNQNLQNHHGVLFKNPAPKIFVPLCGKTLDMRWLAEKGAHIFGVDLVRQALDEYCSEQGLPPVEHRTENLTTLTTEKHTLFHGDVFTVTVEHTGKVDAIFDRAALVALPLEMRQRYAMHCLSLLKPGGSILLITYDSPVEDEQGPPFPVRKGTVETLYSTASSCTQLDEVLMTADNDPRLQKRGIDWSRADIWEICK